MTILEVYSRYDIPPNLQEHQLTVAAVASAVCSAQKQPVDAETIVRACLIHDMGNILKYKFDATGPGLTLENVGHWKAVKQRFLAQYGPDEHEATYAIARELGVAEPIRALLHEMGFERAAQTLKEGKRDAIIASYSDMRGAPTGVTSLSARLENIRERYGSTPVGLEREHAYEQMEAQIFAGIEIGPESITEESIVPIRDELRSAVV